MIETIMITNTMLILIFAIVTMVVAFSIQGYFWFCAENEIHIPQPRLANLTFTQLACGFSSFLSFAYLLLSYLCELEYVPY